MSHKLQAFPEICNFDNGLTDNPEGGPDGSKYTTANIMKSSLVGVPFYIHAFLTYYRPNLSLQTEENPAQTGNTSQPSPRC
jgi:hypothetical protein